MKARSKPLDEVERYLSVTCPLVWIVVVNPRHFLRVTGQMQFHDSVMDLESFVVGTDRFVAVNTEDADWSVLVFREYLRDYARGDSICIVVAQPEAAEVLPELNRDLMLVLVAT